MSSHTPGKWTVEDAEAAHGAAFRVMDEQEVTVALCYQQPDDTWSAKANADLIAAAPELLACVRDLVGCANPNRDRRELRVARALLRRIESPSSGAEAAEPQEGGPG